MGIQPGVRQFDSSRLIVAFDFDGTLTVRDSFLSYLAFQAGRAGYVLGLIRLLPALIVYAVDRDRGRLKSAAATIFLRGITETALGEAAERFADGAFGGLMRPDAAQVWAAWKARGAVMTIVTASPDTMVAPFARRLDADVLIGTELAFDANGRATGAFSTPNCRGAEKVRRLQAVFGPDMTLAAAYGDTAGDREMIAMAMEKGYRVFTARP